MFRQIFDKKTGTKTPVLHEAILNELQDVSLRLEAARNHFNYILQEDLIDASVHEIQGLETRYRYLITAAKDLRINAENIELRTYRGQVYHF